ncbi:MAG: hypothetical protein HY017_29835 [Betaproteobacteria bacterium]|nr:hypothetical protein [Betaproteobacteria bacterium]
MLKFKYIKVADRRYRSLNPTHVTSILRAMQKRPTWEGVIVSPDAKLGPDGQGQYPILSLAWYPEQGYEVHCIEQEPISHFLAISEELSKPTVCVELGGQGQELWPCELFVPFAMASTALKHFLQTGGRDSSLPWIRINAFPRHKVRPRKSGSPAHANSDA